MAAALHRRDQRIVRIQDRGAILRERSNQFALFRSDRLSTAVGRNVVISNGGHHPYLRLKHVELFL